MLILLPPSEGKYSPEAGPRFKPASLGFPELKATRAVVLGSLIELCSTRPARAATILGLGSKQRELIDVNAQLRSAPCAPAIDTYSGVLYDALDFASLPAAARKRADGRIAIASALFGLLRPSDRIPAYRLSGDTTLPALGTLASVWREAISAELARHSGPILDLRSAAYIALGPVPESVAHRSFIGRVLLEKNGKRSVVSHHNKATKGRLVRAVLQSPAVPKKADDVPEYVRKLGFTAELREPAKDGAPLGLDIIVYTT